MTESGRIAGDRIFVTPMELFRTLEDGKAVVLPKEALEEFERFCRESGFVFSLNVVPRKDGQVIVSKFDSASL